MANNNYLYIMASDSGTLYIGVTGDLARRASEHKQDFNESFTKKYKCHKLIYYENYTNIKDAIGRETQMKKWRRDKKENLIKKINPTWDDLTVGW